MTPWDEVRQRVDLREVVGRTHQISGGKILCPFHPDRDPSCHVYADHFHCYGCGAHGDVIDWVARQRGSSRWEALQVLAQEYGIPLRIDSSELRREFDRRDQMLKAEAYWCDRLWHNTDVLDYLHGRGLSDDSIRRYRIGYRPETGQIVLPVADVYGHPVGWQFHNWTEELRRAAGRDGQLGPKYQTMRGMNRGQFLYGLPQARALWQPGQPLYIVEGPYDAISVCQVGKPAVATMGSLSAGQVKALLTSFPDAVFVLVPDTTEEGFEKAERAGLLIRSVSSSVICVSVLSEKDANDALVAGVLEQQVEARVNFWVWLAKRVLERGREASEQELRRIYQQADLAVKEEVVKAVAEAWEVEPGIVRRALGGPRQEAVRIYTVEEAFERWEQVVDMATHASPWLTGWPVLDKYIDLVPGRIAHVEGRAGIGKTAMLVQLVLNLLLQRGGAKILIAGFEPSPEDIVSRVAINIASRLGYIGENHLTEMQQAVALRRNPEAWDEVKQVIDEWLVGNVCFVHGPMTIGNVAAAAARAEAHLLREKLDFIFIDYLELAETKHAAFYRHNFEIVKEAQALAAATNTFVFALRQIARGRAESRVAEPGEAAGTAVGEAQTDIEIVIRRRFPVPGQPHYLIAKIRKNRGGLEWPQAEAQGLLFYPWVYRIEHWMAVTPDVEARFIKEDKERERELQSSR